MTSEEMAGIRVGDIIEYRPSDACAYNIMQVERIDDDVVHWRKMFPDNDPHDQWYLCGGCEEDIHFLKRGPELPPKMTHLETHAANELKAILTKFIERHGS